MVLKPTRTLPFSLSLAFMLVFSLSSAQAQSDQANKSTSGEGGKTDSSSADGARPRRADEKSNVGGPAQGDSADGVDSTPLAIGKSVDRISTLRSQIQNAKDEQERVRLHRLLVDYLVALNRKGEAIDELRAMSREDRVDPIGFYNIGNALARLGDTDAAIDAYRKAIKQRHGNYSHAFNNLGVVLLRQGRWDEAAEALQSALKLENFHYGEASYNLGRLYAARGEMDLAMREWTRALQVQPDHADAAVALARTLAEDGSPERGLAVLDAFLARRGSNAEVEDARREILFSSVEEASADNISNTTATTSAKAEGAKSEDGKHSSTTPRTLAVDQETYDLLGRARAARADGRNEEAATLYRRVLSRKEGFFAPANLELGFVLSSLKRYDEAAAMFESVVSREGARYPVAYYHLGRQYESLGKLDLAEEAFEKAAAAYDDTNPQFLLDVSRVREKKGDYKAALKAVEDYVSISRKLGRVPEWTNERLAELRKKAETK